MVHARSTTFSWAGGVRGQIMERRRLQLCGIVGYASTHHSKAEMSTVNEEVSGWDLPHVRSKICQVWCQLAVADPAWVTSAAQPKETHILLTLLTDVGTEFPRRDAISPGAGGRILDPSLASRRQGGMTAGMEVVLVNCSSCMPLSKRPMLPLKAEPDQAGRLLLTCQSIFWRPWRPLDTARGCCVRLFEMKIQKEGKSDYIP